MKNTKDGMRFLAFIQKLRKEKGFTLQQLCHGLCSAGAVKNMEMESGSWMPDKLLQDCLLERLGVAAEDYVHMLGVEEYQHWEDRMRLLHSITFDETAQMETLLMAYEKNYDINNRLERQFYLAMKAQIRQRRGCSDEELSALLEEAVNLTVDQDGQGKLAQLALSVKELNLLLEAEKYRKEGERPERYQEVLEYIEESRLDEIGKVKIYPKAIYLMCRCAMQKYTEGTEWNAEKLLRYCDRGIELLRENERMYYLWELLHLEEKLVSIVAEKLRSQGQEEKARILEEVYRERRQWKQALEGLYGEYGVPKETVDFCYIYVMKGVCCVNDVIRIRRNMFGISQAKLCDGICTVKTLRRLEQHKTSPQREIAIQLLHRLGVSGELTRTDLVTDQPEARRLMEQLRDLSNKGEWEEAEKLRRRIQEMVSMEIPVNQQTLVEHEILLKWKKDEIGREDYCVQMQEILELTLPYPIFLRRNGGENEKYLTEEEQTCILNWMQGMDEKSEEHLLCMQQMEELYRSYIETGLWEGMWNMYELVANNIGSAWGNRGEYDKADWHSGTLLKGCLHFRRMGMLHTSIYDRWWNHDMRKITGIPTDKVFNDEEELSKCILFSVMAKDIRREQFYRKKLKLVKSNL